MRKIERQRKKGKKINREKDWKRNIENTRLFNILDTMSWVNTVVLYKRKKWYRRTKTLKAHLNDKLLSLCCKKPSRQNMSWTFPLNSFFHSLPCTRLVVGFVFLYHRFFPFFLCPSFIHPSMALSITFHLFIILLTNSIFLHSLFLSLPLQHTNFFAIVFLSFSIWALFGALIEWYSMRSQWKHFFKAAHCIEDMPCKLATSLFLLL